MIRCSDEIMKFERKVTNSGESLGEALVVDMLVMMTPPYSRWDSSCSNLYVPPSEAYNCAIRCFILTVTRLHAASAFETNRVQN